MENTIFFKKRYKVLHGNRIGVEESNALKNLKNLKNYIFKVYVVDRKNVNVSISMRISGTVPSRRLHKGGKP